MNRLLATPEGGQAFRLDGRTYALDRLPDPHRLSASLPRFREAFPSVPEAKWDEVDLIGTFNPPLLDQIQNGCVGHGGCTAFTLAWLASGQAPPEGGFSPTWAYALTNRGHDQGASIGDLIEALTTVGLCSARVFPETKYFLGGPAEAPARAEAAAYRLEDAYAISSWEEKGTALHLGYSVADSIQVGNDFMQLDPDGFVPVDRGPGNHCTAPGRIRRFKGRVGVGHQNSWKSLPYFFTSADHVASQGAYYSGVVFRTVRRKPGSETPTIA